MWPDLATFIDIWRFLSGHTHAEKLVREELIGKYGTMKEDVAKSLGSMWPDLAKFRLSVNILKVFGNCLKVYLTFAKMFNLLWKFIYAIGHIFLVTNGQIWENKYSNLVTLSRYVAPNLFCNFTLFLWRFESQWWKHNRTNWMEDQSVRWGFGSSVTWFLAKVGLNS